MTQEDKELLLKDICARLPYGVKVLADCDKTFDQGLIGVLVRIDPYVGNDNEYQGKYLLYQYGVFTPSFVDEVRPYLYPLSSMTEEQKKELDDTLVNLNLKALSDEISSEVIATYEVDFYNKYHFDYRGLIPKGLAIDATGLNIY